MASECECLSGGERCPQMYPGDHDRWCASCLRAELETAERDTDEARTLVRELTDTSEESTIRAAIERKAVRFVYSWDTGEPVKRGADRKGADDGE